MRTIIVAIVAVSFCGCASQAGPFVTNISSDVKGGLIIEKCMVRLDRMINTVEASSCTSTPITLSH